MQIKPPLYYWHDVGQAMMAGPRLWAGMTAAALGNANNPLAGTPWAKAMVAGCDVFERLTREYEKQPFDIKPVKIGKCEVPIVEEVVLETPFCRLVRFRRDVDSVTGKASDVDATRKRIAKQSKVFLAAPLSGHYATLLRSTVTDMSQHGEVYITDWKCASTIPKSVGAFSFDDYVHLMRRFLTEMGPGTHAMAVCQPSVPLLAAIALMNEDKDPCTPPSLTVMGGPIDTRINPQGPNVIAAKHSLEDFRQGMVHEVPWWRPGAGREVCPGFLQLFGFVLPNFQSHAEAYWDYFHNLQSGAAAAIEKHRRFYNEFNAVLAMPAEYYLQTIDYVFQRHLLPKGELMVGGRRVNLGAITKTAVLSVEGENDDITGTGQTKAVHTLLTSLPASMKRHHEEPEVGHYGVFSGSRCREHIIPVVAEFQAQHTPRPARRAA